MRLYTILLSVFVMIIATVNARYCCDKSPLGPNGGFICTQYANTKCECPGFKKSCCDCRNDCNWWDKLWDSC